MNSDPVYFKKKKMWGMRSANLAELCDLGREVKSPQSQTNLKKGQVGGGREPAGL